MVGQTVSAEQTATFAVSSPGGLARQFRVQLYQPDESSWRLYGIFRRRDEAQSSLENMRKRGYRARLIESDFCPTAI